MPTRLVALVEGPDIRLGREPIAIGRHPLCDVRLSSIRVSRRHCCMTEVDGEVAVRDLASTNGTRINDRRVDAGRLRLGDTLTIAHLRNRLEEGRTTSVRRFDAQAASTTEGASPQDIEED
jgi:pSer/pThr/pTyr-binding forkhead associated (FHA) protein